MKLVSACLLGVNCRYDGRNELNRRVIQLASEECLIPVCPEQLGGLGTPREPSEIKGGDGSDVLNGGARVFSKSGRDATENFLRGAGEVLKIARTLGVKEAILKARSTACGCGKIHDGTFSGGLIEGDGVTTALLKRNGIRVLTEENL